MVEAGLGDFTCGQAEMTSWWCQDAAGHASVKVCARDRGVRLAAQEVKAQDLFYQGMSVSSTGHFADLSSSFPLSEKG